MQDPLEQQTKEWYAQYYRQRGQWRNDLLRNPEVSFQLLANDAALIKAVRSTGLAPDQARLLDVGCGLGVGLLGFARLGFPFRHMNGIDLQGDRLAEARTQFPAANFVHGDASAMPFPDGGFDLVFESTMFVQLTDEKLAGRIAREMVRVCRPGGFIVLSDWRYSKPFNDQYLGLSRRRIARLFDAGSEPEKACRFHACHRAALLPPIGRRLSHYASPLYFLTHALLPFLSGHVITVLRRNAPLATKS